MESFVSLSDVELEDESAHNYGGRYVEEVDTGGEGESDEEDRRGKRRTERLRQARKVRTITF